MLYYCQVSVKLRWKGFQKTYMLTGHRHIWHQPKHSMQLRPKQYTAQLHISFPTCDCSLHKMLPLCHFHGRTESRHQLDDGSETSVFAQR